MAFSFPEAPSNDEPIPTPISFVIPSVECIASSDVRNVEATNQCDSEDSEDDSLSSTENVLPTGDPTLSSSPADTKPPPVIEAQSPPPPPPEAENVVSAPSIQQASSVPNPSQSPVPPPPPEAPIAQQAPPPLEQPST